MKMTPEKQQMIDWLHAKNACREGRKWAERECNSLAEVWAKAKPDWLIWVACRALDKRKSVAFAAACAERVRHLMTDQRIKYALDVAHRYGCGEATDAELAAAAYAAAYAAYAAADAAYAADAAAAADAYAAGAYAYAAGAAAWAAADAAASVVAATASVVAADAERQWQAAHLRANFQPDWSL